MKKYLITGETFSEAIVDDVLFRDDVEVVIGTYTEETAEKAKQAASKAHGIDTDKLNAFQLA